MKENKKPSKKVKIIGNAVFFSVISVMIAFFVWNFIDIKSGYKYPIFGTRTSVIVSPSMETVNPSNTYITSEMQQIKKYDVITTVGYQSFDEIQLYDVATYYNGSKDLVCHRVVDKYIYEGKQYVVFRGDANNIDDAPVSYDLVRGKVVNVTPQAGHVVAFFQSPYLFIALFGTGFFVALGFFIATYNKEKKQAEPVQEAPLDEPKEEIKEDVPEEEEQETKTEEESPEESQSEA